jgi:DHA2 family multidrug resistance protein
VGISAVQGLLVHNAQVLHASLSAHLTPYFLANHLHGALQGAQGLALLDGAVNAQGLMIAYLDDFKLMLILTVAALPLLLWVRTARKSAAPEVILE